MVRIFTTALALAAAFSQISAAPVADRRAAAMAARDNHANEYGSGSYEYGSSSQHQWQEKPAAEHKVEQKEEWKHTSAEAAKHEPTPTYEQKEEPKHTTPAHESKQTELPKYGSGHKVWGGEGYNDCVQKCLAKHPLPTHQVKPDEVAKQHPTETVKGGNGNVHTVIVAPTQGVLRFIPFALNASVGDTVRFVWGAGPHTVTQSSALNPCNSSSLAEAFASGRQNKSFVFDKVVNTTDPVYYFCAVGAHCQNGMFGIINPAAGSVANVESQLTVGSYLQSKAAEDPATAAMWNYVSNKTAGTSAAEWGMGFDLSNIPESQYAAMAENTMYTQLFYASNPGALETGKGAVDQGNGIVIPSDIKALSAEPVPSASTDPATANPVEVPNNAVVDPSPTSAGLGAETGTPVGNGAGRTGASAALIAVVAVVVSFIAI